MKHPSNLFEKQNDQVFLSHLRHRARSILFSFLIWTMVLSSCSMEMCFNLGISRESKFSRYADSCFAKTCEPYDVIIVPGIPYKPTSVSSIMKTRLLWAKYLYDNGLARNIIFSGSAVHTPYVEGRVMKIIADSLGIPSDHTFFEVEAEHSTENIYYSWMMARKMGFTRIAVATDPFQAFMLRRFVKKHFPDVVSVPVVYKKVKSKQKTLPTIDATDAYEACFVSLVDRENFAKRLKGTRGFKVAEKLKQEQSASLVNTQIDSREEKNHD